MSPLFQCQKSLEAFERTPTPSTQLTYCNCPPAYLLLIVRRVHCLSVYFGEADAKHSISSSYFVLLISGDILKPDLLYCQ